MDIKITPHILEGEIDAPSSKSYLHRLLIAAYISGRRVFIECGEFSDDISATAGVLSAMGAEIKKEKGGVSIEKKAFPSEEIIADCKESGSTLRFLFPLAAALGINARFIGSERLLSRPISPLREVINKHGAKADGYVVKGRLECGDYIVDGSLSSQFVTGILFALTALGGKSTLIITGKKVSEGYIGITLEVLKMFGADINYRDDRIIIGGMKSEVRRARAEGDWSNAAFFLAAGAIGGDITVRNLNESSAQGDKNICGVLKKFGADVEKIKDGIKVRRGQLKGIDIDIEDIPDLAQIISVVAAYSYGVTVLRNVERLRLKESDRVDAIINTLGTSGVRAEYIDGKIIIYGGRPKGGIFSGGNDHRTVMSQAILASFAEGRSVIKGAEACRKSFPDFFEKFTNIGGRADVIV